MPHNWGNGLLRTLTDTLDVRRSFHSGWWIPPDYFPCFFLASGSLLTCIHWKLCRSLELSLCVILSYPGPCHSVNFSGSCLFKLFPHMRVTARICYVSENIIYILQAVDWSNHICFPFSERLLFCATCLMYENCCFI